MCPISIEELRDMAPAVPIGDDRLCVRCGYNLKGLTSKDRCPECGTPVRTRRTSVRQSGMIEAPPEYVRSVRQGVWCLLASGAGAVAVIIVGALGVTTLLHAVSLCALVWALGTWNLTAPRTADDVPRGDSAWLRAALRSAAFGFLFAGLAISWFLVAGLALFGPILVWAAALAAVAGLAGCTGTMWWCARLAEWANDDATARTLRYHSWAVPLALVPVLAGMYIGTFLGLWAGANAVLIGAWMGAAVPVVLVAWAMLRFARLIDWSSANAAAIKAKDDRLRERARIAAQTGKDPGFAPVAQRSCRSCGYDLAGILRSPVCPECGQSIE